MELLNFCISVKTLERAGLNTVLGIGIVFLMLVLISCIIALLKLVNRPAAPAPVNQVKAPEPEPVAETDDTELVAVIAAAICAYEAAQGNAVSPDSLVVRSIRKVNKSRWQKA